MACELIKRIEVPLVRVKSPEGEEYVINEYEWMHLRVQIKQHALSGWSWFDLEISEYRQINQDGRMWYYPPQFEIIQDYLYELL